MNEWRSIRLKNLFDEKRGRFSGAKTQAPFFSRSDVVSISQRLEAIGEDTLTSVLGDKAPWGAMTAHRLCALGAECLTAAARVGFQPADPWLRIINPSLSLPAAPVNLLRLM